MGGSCEEEVWDGKVKLHVELGGEHGFDCDVPLKSSLLQEGLKGVIVHWLGQTDTRSDGEWKQKR